MWEKIFFNYGQKKEKSPQESESEDELHRVHLREQEGVKHRLIDVVAVPVLIRYAWKQLCFKVCFLWLNFIRKELAANVTILIESVEAYVFHLVSKISGVCLSVFVMASQRMLWFMLICFVCLCWCFTSQSTILVMFRRILVFSYY